MLSMKYSVAFLLAIFFITACSRQADLSSLSARQSVDTPLSEPVLPISDAPPLSNQPKKPDLNLLDEGDGEYDVDIARVIEVINQDLDRPTISAQDIERGWYYGGRDDKKFGTPDSWRLIQDGERTRWARMGLVEAFIATESDQLCRQTAGKYVFSCLDHEVDGCEYILESLCRCSEKTQWFDQQGCIQIDSAGQPVEITLNELEAGFYLGLTNQKKLNTPPEWTWEDLGPQSRWFLPLPEPNVQDETALDLTLPTASTPE
ncbi:hypothetical protein IPJ72_00980 [Candidatus Peregrinibacteria bacterium]|nr:MAG: hypothetical protein IPJ72_00980 [Candidatus Peregrinibacteria bacterium]